MLCIVKRKKGAQGLTVRPLNQLYKRRIKDLIFMGFYLQGFMYLICGAWALLILECVLLLRSLRSLRAPAPAPS